MTIKRQVAEIREFALMISLGVSLLVVAAEGIVPNMLWREMVAGIAAVVIVIVILVERNRRKKNWPNILEKAEEKKYIKELSSIYKRKMMVNFILCFAMMALAIGNSYILPIGVFLVCNNGVKQYLVSKLNKEQDQSQFYRYVRKMVGFSLLYWFLTALILLICYLSGIGMSGLNNLLVLAAMIDLAIFCWYFLSVRNEYAELDIKISPYKKAVVVILCLAILASFAMGMKSWWLSPYIQSISEVGHESYPISYDGETGSYSITMNKESFKILQLTDIHLTGSVLSSRKDVKALDAVYKLIREAKPDLVIITGDLIYPMGLFTFSVNNASPIKELAAFMEKVNVPWAFVYGNHDTEAVATHSAEQLAKVLAPYSYSLHGKNLLLSQKQPQITGRNNQLLQIKNQDGTLNQALFLLDSNAYVSKGSSDYDYIHEDQVNWYEKLVKELSKEQGKTISSLLFFHIPLQEYEEAYELYKKGSKEVTYYFGTMEEADGGVSASHHGSSLFDAVTRLQSTKGIFVGHDHYNTICLGYKGVKLTYGMSIDYVAMPGIAKRTTQRGGTLITLHKNSEFDIQQIPLTSLTD
ncbi:MAG: metallophosphoesterase family protein [bacterium]|nr:metallophosphoesterase family protein [bacterium]